MVSGWGPSVLAFLVAVAGCGNPGADGSAGSGSQAASAQSSAAYVPSAPAGETGRAREPDATDKRGDEVDEDDYLGPQTEKFDGGARAFARVKELMLTSYYEAGLTEDDLYRAAVRGILENADPRMKKWNKLLSPTALGMIRNDLRGEFVGLGVQIKFDDVTGHTDVIDTVPGSPAARAGLAAGDVIVTVNGKLFRGRTLRDVVGELRGHAGDPVVLNVLRGDKLTPLTLVRDVVTHDIAPPLVLPDQVGYVHIDSFSARTASGVKNALAELAAKEVRALVLDLRGNSGGSFEDAVATAELLLPKGSGVVTLRRRGGKAERFEAKGEPLLPDVPLAVLVDGGTSSGAELVAAALAEGRKAQLVGQRTLGKWSVQTIEELPSGYAVKYTTALFESPSGRTFDGTGLPPDVDVSMDARRLDKTTAIADPAARLAADVQLRTATALVRPRPGR